MIFPKKYKEIELLDKGKHGLVYKAKLKDKFVAIKTKLPSSKSQNTAILEANYLEKVNKFNIGPKLIEKNENYVVMEFIEGVRIDKFLETATNEEKEKVINNILKQLETLDKNNINKSELTNPYKHIIINKKLKPVLIDFERARFKTKPQNVNQFKEYLKKHT
ncbi:MAG: RIO1 family regulatory kinase/ATPase [Candidatus Woesearchaeota archaeon]